MKKILLLSAVLLGAVTASQAGVRFSIGIPFPAPPVVVAPPAPVYVQPPAETYVQPPAETYVQPPAVYAPAPVVVAPPVFDFSFGDSHPYYRSYPYHPYYHRDYHDYHHDYHDYHHGDHDHYHR